jgi:ectoine hydroxylase-related dioxygenase (phytanoyl-CoA dioxygenase family)
MQTLAPNITSREVEFYRENGYLVVENALTREEIDELRRDTVAICRGQYGEVRGIYPHAPTETDDDVMRSYLCIHFPHKLSPTMAKYLAHPAIVDVLTQVIGPNVKSMQSMLFIKAAGKPGQAWHQDEDFIPSRDRSLTGGWIALDDATIDNGCLWVLPGSHKRGILWEMKRQDDPRFDCTDESYGFPYRDEDAVPVEVPAGSIVFFNGYLLHRSLPNTRATGYRRVLVNHYMSAESLLPWNAPTDGRQVAVTDYRDVVMIAGSDPYAYKGYTDLAEAHVRRDKMGGCRPSDIVVDDDEDDDEHGD